MPRFQPEKHHIDDVKRELPPVRIRYNGKLWWGRTSGRLNRFCSVSPYQEISSRKHPTTIIGPIFHFSWESVCRAVVNGSTLNCD